MREAAPLLSLGINETYEMVARGELPSIRLGPRRIRLDPEALRNWIRQKGQEAQRSV